MSSPELDNFQKVHLCIPRVECTDEGLLLDRILLKAKKILHLQR